MNSMRNGLSETCSGDHVFKSLFSKEIGSGDFFVFSIKYFYSNEQIDLCDEDFVFVVKSIEDQLFYFFFILTPIRHRK